MCAKIYNFKTPNREVNVLKSFLTEAKRERDIIYEEGTPSFWYGLTKLAHIPISVHIALKLFFKVAAVTDPVFTNLLIPLSGSSLLAAYFSVPLTSMMLFFLKVGKDTHDNYENEVCAQEEVIQYLEDEIATKENVPSEELKFSSSKDPKYAEYLQRTHKRLTTIKTLSLFRDRVLYHYNRGTLEAYLQKIGISEEELKPSIEYIEKRFVMEQKERR